MFEPTDKAHKHAIREAVFGATLAQPLTSEQLQRFSEFGSTLSELPSKQEPQVLSFPIVPGMIASIGATSFQAFKADGTLSWRLLVQQNQIAVNCLDYNGWDDVWPRARDYIRRTLDLLSADETVVKEFLLQYINAFHWRGDASVAPDFTTLLKRDSDRIPNAFWHRSSMEWHLHQGWFEEVTSPLPGKVLVRDHLTSQREPNTGLTVTVDILDRNDLQNPMPIGELSSEKLDVFFDAKRRRLRHSLRTYLNEKVCEEIGAVAL
jgi:uncharacterized protein (TIGR04255 family)